MRARRTLSGRPVWTRSHPEMRTLTARFRAVFETMGVHDVVAKSVGTANPHNMVKATFAALRGMMSPRLVAARRGKKVGDLVGRRGEAGPGDKD